MLSLCAMCLSGKHTICSGLVRLGILYGVLLVLGWQYVLCVALVSVLYVVPIVELTHYI